jgi:hypothetical protein
MAKIVKRRPTPESKRPPQTAHPAILGKKPLSPVVKRRPKGK